MNDKGISFVETLLTVVIIMLLTGSLIPLSSKLQETLQIKKIELHVSQVAYNAAKQIVDLGTKAGTEIIDKTSYHWMFDGQNLCVNFQLLNEVEIRCFTQKGVI